MATTALLHPRVRDLTRGPVAPALLLFALPTMAATALQTLSGTVNAMWVGRLLGENALAATLNGNLISQLTATLVFGAGMSATVLIGQAIGRRDLETVKRVMGGVFGAFAGITLGLALIGWLAAPTMLQLLGVPEDALPLALSYLRVTLLGLPGGLLASLVAMGLRGVGDSVSPLLFTLCTVVVDTVLNPIFILGLGPAPAMGIAGAAAALAVANYITLALILVWVYRRDLPIRLSRSELRYLRPDRSLLWEIVRKGLPMGFQMIVLTLAGLLCLSLVNREGVQTTAAYSVVQLLWTYLHIPILALQASVSTLTAQAIGAGAWGRVRLIVKWGMTASLGLTGIAVCGLMWWDGPLIAWFLGGHDEAVLIAEHILQLTAWSFLFTAASTVFGGSLRADGVVIGPLLIAILTSFLLRLAVAYGGRDVIGPDALWLSMPAAQAATLVLMSALYLMEFHRRRRPIEMRQVQLAEEVAATDAAGRMQ